MKYVRSRDGFTLIEMLIVLSVISIILLFSIFMFRSFSESMQKRLFFTQLESDLYYAHAYAQNRKEAVQVRFSRGSKQYEMLVGKQQPELFLIRKFPPSIYIKESTISSFVITPDGNVSTFGIITFQHNQTTVKVSFNIGKGRFNIEE
ncbi:prepilin-type N-terminal cleavage/methylation domain-containing protein [Lederbergia sp. NSJ-179]|uniref:competence type IV pilus minor pilin ComGD n=1 Tax=Lederbergia sp. NSJ-179 TaxID=2931402 RepID=UPI001FD27185|nr:competence type IV pilus minor pilin ComGD [Lederbergia sp. NSJ-179]MCJ7839316.1 prepilin-type N-terminal cleavage/methylation domain-containing protein [Lederbergia sp. NSJ-179]